MKRRCVGCGEYFLREAMRVVGLTAVCSDACFQQFTSSKPTVVDRSKTINISINPKTNGRLSKHSSARQKPGVTSETATTVLRRDQNCCRFCGRPGVLRLHHVRYRSEGNQGGRVHDATNLVALHDECHLKVHADKRVMQPLLLEVLRLFYEDGKLVTVLDLQRR